jgi:hypothetical protein
MGKNNNRDPLTNVVVGAALGFAAWQEQIEATMKPMRAVALAAASHEERIKSILGFIPAATVFFPKSPNATPQPAPLAQPGQPRPNAIEDVLRNALEKGELSKSQVLHFLEVAVNQGIISPAALVSFGLDRNQEELTEWERKVGEYYEHYGSDETQEIIAGKFDTSRSNLALVLTKYEGVTGKKIKKGRGRKRR